MRSNAAMHVLAVRSRVALRTLLTGCALAALTACRPEAAVPPEPTVIDDAALASDTSGADWRAYGRTSDEQRFSPLDQINDGNVASLAVDWFLELPTDKGLVSTPLVVDGVLYFVGSMNVVRAVDATSGELLWEYDPRVRDHARRMQAGWDHNRGIAYYKGRIYAATWDGRKSGEPLFGGVWSEGRVTIRKDPDLAARGRGGQRSEYAVAVARLPTSSAD